ncbi:MAG: hypothetical protein WKG07_26375 [Hymenobacter sp.]
MEDVLLNRRADATERLRGLRRNREAEGQGGGSGRRLAQRCPWHERLQHALVQRHHRVYRPGHRGSAPAIAPARST